MTDAIPKTPLDIISDAIQANVALGLMALLIILLMRQQKKSGENHREDMHSQELATIAQTAEIRKFRDSLVDLSNRIVTEIVESDRRIESLRYALNKELVRKGRPSVPMPPNRFPTVRPKRDTKKDKPS